MKKYNKTEEITQRISMRVTNVAELSVLEAFEGKGYENTLNKPYMMGLKEYLEKAKDDIWLQNSHAIFLSENSYVTLQACAIWKKYKDMWKNKDSEQENEDDYDYDLFSHIPQKEWNKKNPNNIGEEEIAVVKKKSCPSEQEELEKRMGMAAGMFAVEEELQKKRKTLLAQAKTIFLDYGVILHPDETLEEILQVEAEQIAVAVAPKGSYEYFMKRLSFEGNFQVIRLGKPSLKEYVEYGESFLAYYGFQLDKKLDMMQVIQQLSSYRGSLMKEDDIYHYLANAFEKAQLRGERILRNEDLKMNYYSSKREEELEHMIGLEETKALMKRFLASMQVMEGKITYRNLIFSGNPGTGKSCVARLLAKTMGEMGISNGRFVDASRSDLIGKYVGHTSAQVQKIFEKADGGVLFIDEASFLLEEDKFVQEAVIELVRYMELYPQTMVIFATYPKEAKELLHRDAGLSSRIYKVIPFESYGNEQLWEIAKYMANKMGFEIEEGCRETLNGYLETKRKQQDFGNAREIRKLLQAVIEEYAIRQSEMKEKELNQQCFAKAIEFLNQQEVTKSKFGFCV